MDRQVVAEHADRQQRSEPRSLQLGLDDASDPGGDDPEDRAGVAQSGQGFDGAGEGDDKIAASAE